MIRVRFARDPKWADVSMLKGSVEIDGVDISRRTQALTFRHDHDGSNRLTLELILYGDDVVDLDIPDEALAVNVRALKDGELAEVTAVGDKAVKYALHAT